MIEGGLTNLAQRHGACEPERAEGFAPRLELDGGVAHTCLLQDVVQRWLLLRQILRQILTEHCQVDALAQGPVASPEGQGTWRKDFMCC